MGTQLITAPEPSGPDAERLQRGAYIAAWFRIRKTQDGYKVPSEHGNGVYDVSVDGDDEPACNCPDFELRSRPCKHIYAVHSLIQEELGYGESGEAEAPVKPPRPTYGQDWRAYDAAQENEEAHFEVLFRQLCDLVVQPVHQSGRPRLPVSDVLYCIGMKVYHNKSRRRVMTAVRRAEERGLLDSSPSDASITKYLADPDLTPVLKYLIQWSSLPLKDLETSFAIDSTGFSTSVYDRWFDEKWGKPKRRAKFVKLHLTCGVKTQIITTADASNGWANDAPFLVPQLQTTAENFDVQQLAADKAYVSKTSHEDAESMGVTLLIPFKTNSVSKDRKRRRNGAWERAYHFFQLHNDEFLERYHQRSIAESAVQMIKSKFGQAVFSKSETAQRNEGLVKIVCHNVYCLIRTAYELGVEAELESWLSDSAAPGGPGIDDRVLAIAP